MAKSRHDERQDANEPNRQNVIRNALELKESISGIMSEQVQKQLLKIYTEQIRPLEEAYRFSDLNMGTISEGDMLAKPMILFLGPWSSGKSSMINYLLGIEESVNKLHTGAQPTTSEFTVVNHGPEPRDTRGIQLVIEKSKQFKTLENFGLNFLERLHGVELPNKLLEHVTLVDTPGIIENKKQERGYPFHDVCQWFIDRAHLIFLMFDPAKLDIGTELEEVFRQLKGHEAKLRLILNKADSVSTQELMSVYGALFWSLAPIMREVEPPHVYMISMSSIPYLPDTMHSYFEQEEISLLTEIHNVIRYELEYKIAATRRHAFLVRLHALAVNSYKDSYAKNKYWLLGNNDQVWTEILHDPEKFLVFSQLIRNADISVHDLPQPLTYENFFAVNLLSSFKSLSYYQSGSHMDRLLNAINVDLPNLLQELKSSHSTQSLSQ